MMDRWMICNCTTFSTVFSVLSGQSADDNERLCAMKPVYSLRRFRTELGLNLGLLD